MSAKSIAAFERHLREKHGASPAQSLRDQSQVWDRRARSHYTAGKAALEKSLELAAMAEFIESKSEKLK